MLLLSEKIALTLGFLDLLTVSVMIPHLAVNLKRRVSSPIFYGLFGTTYAVLQALSVFMIEHIVVFGQKAGVTLAFCLSGVVYFLFSLNQDVLLFFMARAVLGLVKHTQTALKAYLVDNIPSNVDPQVLNRFNGISRMGFIAGPLLGMFITRFDTACVAAAIVFVSCGLVAHLFLLDTRSAPQGVPTSRRPLTASLSSLTSTLTSRHTGFRSQPGSGFRALRTVNWMSFWKMFGGQVLLSLAVGVYRSNLGYQLLEAYSVTTQQLASVTSLMGVVAVAADLIVTRTVSRHRTHRNILLVGCTMALTGSLVLLSLSIRFRPTIIVLMLFQASSSMAAALEFEAAANRDNMGGQTAMLQSASERVMPLVYGLTPLINGVLQSVHIRLPALVGAVLASVACLTFLKKRKRL
ncbi:Major facilitator superfamily domain-containing protein 9-like [Tropilaelaps mercedesae]|uniref:Major facilitator superfamily domain-containing protein 9-like n=1 Tax=Tropilaelaps mercedesae TaxID=418985 RepID=A0A1V9X743_9ACAR|nr:Major facilitator superfamily domain-containing protein 9-like [Tropilaelaps mercedesae]OQR69325.1 Major facilitator superfamily domain-containing protein 9-like [Tropilaelaps mercedesae]